MTTPYDLSFERLRINMDALYRLVLEDYNPPIIGAVKLSRLDLAHELVKDMNRDLLAILTMMEKERV